MCLANSAAGPPSKDKRLRACLIQEAMWHHHKVVWDIKNDPLWPNSHILQLLAVFSPHWDLVIAKFFSHCPQKLTPKPHWDTILGSRSREVLPNTCSIKAEIIIIELLSSQLPMDLKATLGALLFTLLMSLIDLHRRRCRPICLSSTGYLKRGQSVSCHKYTISFSSKQYSWGKPR